MKRFKFFLIIGLIVGLLSGLSSCLVVRKDRGLHKGWYKSPRYKSAPPGQISFTRRSTLPETGKKVRFPKIGENKDAIIQV